MLKKIRLKNSVLLVFIFVLGCSKASDNKSKFQIQLPKTLSQSQKVGKMGVDCYAINLTGPYINSFNPNGQCGIEYGQFVGLIPAGGSVDFTVDYGKNRTLDIYYIPGLSSCNDIGKQGLAQFGSDKVHRIGHVTDLVFDKPEVTVIVNAEAPNSTNTFESLYSTPATCRAGGGALPLASSSFRLVVGSKRGTTGTGEKYSVRIVDQKIKLPPTTTEQLIPHRLGDGL